jgi:hypothetical protein
MCGEARYGMTHMILLKFMLKCIEFEFLGDFHADGATIG